jgi:hypothetical protein
LTQQPELLRSILQRGPHVDLAAWSNDLEALERFAREHKLEGIVAKRSDSRFEPGQMLQLLSDLDELIRHQLALFRVESDGILGPNRFNPEAIELDLIGPVLPGWQLLQGEAFHWFLETSVHLGIIFGQVCKLHTLRGNGRTAIPHRTCSAQKPRGVPRDSGWSALLRCLQSGDLFGRQVFSATAD